MSRSLPISASPLLPPSAFLPISASQSLTAAIGLSHCPRASGAPLRAPARPTLYGAFLAPAPSTQARQTPSPCQGTMKSRCDPKAPRLPRRNQPFPTPSPGSPRTPPTPGCRSSSVATTLRKRGAKGAGAGYKSKKSNFGNRDITFQSLLQRDAATPPG